MKVSLSLFSQYFGEMDATGGRGALSHAVDKQSLDEIVKLLQMKKNEIDDPDSGGRTALTWAAYRHRGEVVKVLLKHGAELNHVDDDGRTPLSWAAEGGSLEVVQLLIDHGADVEWRDLLGAGPLSWAYFHGRDNGRGEIEAIMQLLQAHGANIFREIWLPHMQHCLEKSWRITARTLLRMVGRTKK